MGAESIHSGLGEADRFDHNGEGLPTSLAQLAAQLEVDLRKHDIDEETAFNRELIRRLNPQDALCASDEPAASEAEITEAEGMLSRGIGRMPAILETGPYDPETLELQLYMLDKVEHYSREARRHMIDMSALEDEFPADGDAAEGKQE